MRQYLQDQERLCSVDEALEDIRARRPAFSDIATSYALLQKARLQAQADLPPASVLGGAPDTAALLQGTPLLAPLLEALTTPTPEFLERFRCAARHMLPAAAQAFPKLAPALAGIAVRLVSEDAAPGHGSALASILVSALAPGGAKARSLEHLAEELALDATALHVAARESLLAVLFHEAGLLSPLVDQDAWRRGYCPVCGGGPDVGFMKEGKEDSEFLIAKAGQLWLHCGQCAALWRFPRMRCAGCGAEDPQTQDLLMAEGDLRADTERAHLCQECQGYFTTVNLVDRLDRMNLEMLPISLLHLDLLAQERGFSPLAPSSWNCLG